MALQAAFTQITGVVKFVRDTSIRIYLTSISDQQWQFIIHFHQAVLDNNLATSDITVAYESGWNKYMEEFYSKKDRPEAELIAALVNVGAHLHTFRKLMLNWFDYLIDPYLSYIASCTPLSSIPVFLSATLTSTFAIRTKQLRVIQFLSKRFCTRKS
jgi:hypothetical protein